MSSTYSPDLRIELIGTGDQAGVWGATTNTNLGTLLESAIAGYTSVAVASANQAFTAYNGAADQARNASIALTTSTGANFAVYAPASPKLYVIYNASSYVATIYNSTVTGNTTAAGTGVAIPAGKVMTVWSDGTNFVQQNTHFNSPSMLTPVLGTPASGTLTNCTGLPVTTGISGLGTGVSSALGKDIGTAGAPVLFNNALGTPSSGTLTNVTGLPIDGGTTGTLPVTRGGTGATSITSGALVRAAGTGAFSAATASDIVGQIGSTAVTNATNAANATNATNATTAASCSGNSATATKLTTASGSAPSYSARAWVNFDGTGSTGTNMTIRASANVSSVYKNGTGDYTVYFSTAMPSDNYAAVCGGASFNNAGNYDGIGFSINYNTTPTASYVRVSGKQLGVGYTDVVYGVLSVFA